jgi:uncharacterized protein YjbI with pentapeptide repeats
MDRDEAIRLLTGGPDGIREWNEWRGRHEDIPALSEADLRRAHLIGADLRGALLGEADLRGANLGFACLRGAYLRGADLSFARLFYADLHGADLRGADLREADLREADLREADLSEAKCGDTGFGAVNLSEVKGLESIKHGYPSTVGVDTLVRSRGRIPEAFLRGCGVPATWIEFLKWKDHDAFQAAFARLIEDLKATTGDGHPR